MIKYMDLFRTKGSPEQESLRVYHTHLSPFNIVRPKFDATIPYMYNLSTPLRGFIEA
jgi:hypothetical protein